MLDFLTKTKEINDNYWALLIEPEWITSSIWNIKNGKVEVVATSPATRWDIDLIEPIDASLSSCTQSLPDDFPDPVKTVFGVPSSWLSDGNIKREYLEKLKKICDDLQLEPTGFVVLSEAISHFIKSEEESSLSGVVVGVSSEILDISIFDSGKLIGTTSVMRSVSVEEDVIEGISRLSVGIENLPSRIILFNQNEQELDEIRNNLNNADWDKITNAKFAHVPKIEILDPSKKILAVALAGGSEIANVSGIVSEDTETANMPIEEVNNIEEPEGVTAADLGFTVGPSAPINSNYNQTISQPEVIHQNKIPVLPKIKFKKPNFKFPVFNLNFGNKSLIMICSLIATLFLAAMFSWWVFPKATVTIYVASKKLEESLTVAIGDDLKGQTLEVEVSSEKTKSTTGTKTIGEKAKGVVKIQNGTAFPINLPSGTVVVSSSDLKFVTLKSASISGALTPSTPGVASLDVEAGSIGQEFNLKKDEVFKVGNYPKAEVDGTSSDAFTGGSSRQISSVSEDDKKKILKEITAELLEDAKQKLSDQVTSDMIVVDSSFKTETVDENYSNKVGDEATNLKLNLKLKVTSTVVSKNELAQLSKKSLESKVPSGFVLRDDQLSYEFGKSTDEDKFSVKISANLLPTIDPLNISKQISGKYPKIAEDYLSGIPGFVNAEIRLKPVLKGKLGTLPHMPKNISVEITSEK
jgi:hypothetical protein